MSAVAAWLNFPFPGAWAAGLLLIVLALLLLTSEKRAVAALERERNRRAWIEASYRERQEPQGSEQCLVICMEGNLTYANCHGESDLTGVLTLYTRDKPAGKNRVLRTFGPGEWLSYENGEMGAPAEVAQDDED
jgi:hypothetical protein